MPAKTRASNPNAQHSHTVAPAYTAVSSSMCIVLSVIVTSVSNGRKEVVTAPGIRTQKKRGHKKTFDNHTHKFLIYTCGPLGMTALTSGCATFPDVLHLAKS